MWRRMRLSPTVSRTSSHASTSHARSHCPTRLSGLMAPRTRRMTMMMMLCPTGI
uniref:Alternative protein TNPO2 n=1 Tax=Homo sapiens TaxID=9606 RepID=L8ECE4_HUMAN|nr:alternative protein TNPO2 [Homo sapiens]